MIDFNYHKKRFCRNILAILMVSAMLIATPIGTAQIYAEGGEPDTTPPAFAEGYPKEVPQMNGSRQISIVINSTEKVYYYLVLLPDGAKVPTKEQVVAGKDGDNNIPLKSQNSGSNKYSSIQTGLFAPLHNTSYDVYVVIKDDAGNLSEPSLVNVISPPPADFFVTGFPKTGEIQPDGSKQVEVKVKLKGIDSDRKGKIYWVLLPDKSAAPSIEQIASGTDKSNSPAISTGSPEFSGNTEGSFIVTGTTGGTEYDLYMVVGHTHYAYPLSECTEVVKLDVTTPADIVSEKVCSIGSTEFGTFSEALVAVKTGEIIKLLKDISYEKSVDYDGAVSIKGKIIALDLDGHNLTVSNPTYSGINLSNNAELNVIGGGKLNVNSRFAALNIAYSKFTSDSMVEVMLESQLNSGISAESSSDVNISKGTIKGGIYAYSNNNINVSGPVTINRTGESHGIMLSGVGNTVIVRSVEVLSGSGSGIYMYEGGSVMVGTADNPGYVVGKGDGITTRQGSKRAYVTVYGNVEGGGHGIYAADDAEIKVFGNVDSTSSNRGIYCVKSFAGITSSQSNLIEIHGSASGVNGIYSGGAFGNIKVSGNVNATGTDESENCGIYASYGSVDVTGNVYAPNCIGANAGDNGQITIDGSLTGKKFAWLYYELKTADDKTLPSTKEGYDTYSNNTAFIWIKNSAPPIATYVLTVENGLGNGSYIAGTDVNISAAAAPDGQEFSHWTTENGGIFQNSDSASTIFTMPGNSVTIKANYKAIVISSVKYSITASAGTGGSISPYGSINVEENGSQTFVIIPNNNYTISSVLVDGVEKGAISEYTFSNVTTCHAISAAFAATTSSGIKTKTKSYSVASPVITIKPDKKPNQPLVAATVISPVTDSKGDLIVTVTDNIITEIISKANSEAEKQKRTEKGIGVCIETKTPPDMKALRFVLTQPVLKQLTDSKVQQFEIDCGMLSLSFNLEALNEIRRQSDSDVIIRINKNNELEKSDREYIEVKSLFDIELTHIKNGETQSITDLNKGKLKLTIPYTLSRYDAVGYLFGIAIDRKSGVNRVFGSNYDVNSKSVIIDNDIISTYGVGYIQPSARFTDITDHWAKESIDYIVGRELFKGTSDTCFSPDMIINRGMLVTVLGRLTEADVSTFKNSSFDDVANDMYYMPYIEWAYNNGIIKGVDGNSFEPDRGMTREEVALVLLNYAKATGYSLPSLNNILEFDDNDEISDYAKDAVVAVQQAGIIIGDQNNRFNPKNAVTRAEAAAILQRYIMLTINPKTAGGWGKHDDGQ